MKTDGPLCESAEAGLVVMSPAECSLMNHAERLALKVGITALESLQKPQ